MRKIKMLVLIFFFVSVFAAEEEYPDSAQTIDEPILNFTLYTNDNPAGIFIEERLPANLNSTVIDPTNPTFFIIQEWHSTLDRRLGALLKAMLLQKRACNVFLANWNSIPVDDVYNLTQHVYMTGIGVGNFMRLVMDDYGIDPKNVTLIGFSIGGQVGGVAAFSLSHFSFTPIRIDALVLLNPLPFFNNQTTDLVYHVDRSVANYIMLIHTSIFPNLIADAHIHYYVNGGILQPGCNMFDVPCSHSRAYLVFGEAVAKGGFEAKECGSYRDYKKGKCEGNVVSHLGLPHHTFRPEGKFFLTTNAYHPYSLN